MCPGTSDDHTPYEFLSGIELLTESLPLLVLTTVLSTLIEDTTKYPEQIRG